MSEQEPENISNFSEPSQNLPIQNKVFEFNYGQIHYSNIQESINNEGDYNQCIVHNFLAQKVDDKLIKITEIMVGNRLLRIKDEFKIVSELNEEKEGRKRLGVFGRRDNYSDLTKTYKSDRKNLIKNIINLFLHWLRFRNTQTSQIAIRELKYIIKKLKYFNKSLLKQLYKEKEICECFLEFGRADGQTAIKNSRIKDKECHLKAIKNYMKSFQESKEKLQKEKEKTNSASTSD